MKKLLMMCSVITLAMMAQAAASSAESPDTIEYKKQVKFFLHDSTAERIKLEKKWADARKALEKKYPTVEGRRFSQPFTMEADALEAQYKIEKDALQKEIAARKRGIQKRYKEGA